MKWCRSSLTGFFNFILRVPGISWRQNQALFHSNCYPGSLDADKAAGKIIVCVDTDPTVTKRTKKTAAEGAGAKGLILVDEAERGVPFNSGSFPFSEVANDVGAQILKYINSTNCPHNASPDLISNVNYPSISIAKLGGKQTARTPTQSHSLHIVVVSFLSTSTRQRCCCFSLPSSSSASRHPSSLVTDVAACSHAAVCRCYFSQLLSISPWRHHSAYRTLAAVLFLLFSSLSLPPQSLLTATLFFLYQLQSLTVTATTVPPLLVVGINSNRRLHHCCSSLPHLSPLPLQPPPSICED
ncbi:hypothetical protein BHE74_00004573 [Ensete ventricosum]|uniref:PA domain-containing protein n=1 Tax=Ensete ventricosum TaxID=4639 RepID=A0A445MEA2_ENSVE|nr:hypothetical protein BHE74_00004573 [Ensete ventricosum]RZR72528.1 hypothetical protein BHM03_00014374 [Ensete ventricosum]